MSQYTSQATQHTNAPLAPASTGELLDDVARRLYQLVPVVLEAIQPKKTGAITPEAVVRSLLLAGAGKGFDITYQYAVRRYTKVWKEVQNWEQQCSATPEHVRAHALTCWREELRDREETLRLLEVEILEVKPGSEYDASLHQPHPAAFCETEDPLAKNTIAKVLSPAFRWRNEQGDMHVEPAEVVPFVLIKSEPSRSRRAR